MLTVPNLERWQHYKDRKPPWIKLYSAALDDYEFTKLPDSARFHLLGIWLLASQLDNKLPDDAAWLQRRLHATSEINIQQFVDLHLLTRE